MSVTILDGATGTEMQKIGFQAGDCLETFILGHSRELIGLQKRYIEAGSDIIYAPTFGANRLFLERHGLEKQTSELNKRLVALSQEASGGKALVGGDISPTGVPLEPYGDLERDELVEVYAVQARALESAGVDLFALETQMCGAEAEAAFEAVRGESKKPIFVTFTCDDKGRTLYGEKISELCRLFAELGAAAFGVNCCGDFALLETLTREMKAITELPIIMKPNAGKPDIKDGRPVYSLPPEELGRHALALHEAGASIFGGCCGTDERHIAELAKVLRGLPLKYEHI